MSLVLTINPENPDDNKIILRLPPERGGGVITIITRPDNYLPNQMVHIVDADRDVDVLRAEVLQKLGISEEAFAAHAPGTSRAELRARKMGREGQRAS